MQGGTSVHHAPMNSRNVWRVRALVALVLGAVLLLVACGGSDGGDTPAPNPTGADSTGSLIAQGFPESCPPTGETFDRMNAASYQVFGEAIFPDADGQMQVFYMFIGTAWAVRDRLLVTNAHVAEAFTETAAEGVQLARAIAVQSGTGTVVRLLRGLTHPDYTGDPLRSPDVALFTSQQDLPVTLDLAPPESVLSLGDEILIAGFPGDVDTFITVVPGETIPQATSLLGSVSARRAHDDRDAVTLDTLNMYQHQAPTTPGTSGSAMAHCGLVAAVNNAGTVKLIVSPMGPDEFGIDRQAAAANNFAVHVRHIHEMLTLFDANALQGFELPVTAADVQLPGLTPGPGEPPAATGIVGDYFGGIIDPDAEHEFWFTIMPSGEIEGLSSWPATGDFSLFGQVTEEGTFLILDDAPERLGYRRGFYEGIVDDEGFVVGYYYEEGEEESVWEFAGQRMP